MNHTRWGVKVCWTAGARLCGQDIPFLVYSCMLTGTATDVAFKLQSHFWKVILFCFAVTFKDRTWRIKKETWIPPESISFLQKRIMSQKPNNTSTSAHNIRMIITRSIKSLGLLANVLCERPEWNLIKMVRFSTSYVSYVFKMSTQNHVHSAPGIQFQHCNIWSKSLMRRRIMGENNSRSLFIICIYSIDARLACAC